VCVPRIAPKVEKSDGCDKCLAFLALVFALDSEACGALSDTVLQSDLTAWKCMRECGVFSGSKVS
jgi:hypothetical protein